MSYAPMGRRVVISEYGEDPMEAVDRYLSIEDQAPPDPASLKPTDVVVAVKSCAVGWVDLIMSSGQYQHMAKPPYTPGLECAGEVVWAGDDATVEVGARVLPDGLRTGPRSLGAYQAYGGFASYVVAPSEALVPIPESLSFDHAVNLLGNYETAYHALVLRGRLQPGETILIHGATGSTGLAAVHLAKHLGATVIATSRSASKLKVVIEEGADHGVRTSTDDGGVARFRDEVKALTDGNGVDVVYDPVGGPISLETLRCIRFGGRYLIIGWAATPNVAKGKGGRGAPNVNTLPTNLILMKSLDVLGSPAAIAVHRDPSLRKPRLDAILGWAAEGVFEPHVGPAYALEDIRDAMKAKWQSAFVGGCVVHPG
ncbi:MAG: NADPH:quinone oxidoreductase family protein [Sandaracinaceae bacterium]